MLEVRGKQKKHPLLNGKGEQIMDDVETDELIQCLFCITSQKKGSWQKRKVLNIINFNKEMGIETGV